MEAVKHEQKPEAPVSFPAVPDTDLDTDYIKSLESAAVIPEESAQKYVKALESDAGEEEEEEEEQARVSDPPAPVNTREVFERHWRSNNCVICERPMVIHRSEDRPKGFFTMHEMPGMFPCCLNFAHQSCISNSPWAQAGNNELICPRCTLPEHVPQAGAVRNWIKTKVAEEEEQLKESDESQGWIGSLYHLLLKANERTEALKMRWNKDASVAINYIKAHPPTMDQLLESNWPVRYIHRYVARDLGALLDCGFRMEHLTHMEGEIDSLIAHYGLHWNDNLKRAMEVRYGEEEISLRTIKHLGLTARSMSLLGLHVHELIKMGLKKDMLQHFPQITLNAWVTLMFFNKTHVKIMGLREHDFQPDGVLWALSNWSVENLRRALNLSRDDMETLGLARYEQVSERRHMPRATPAGVWGGPPPSRRKTGGGPSSRRRSRKPRNTHDEVLPLRGFTHEEVARANQRRRAPD